MSPRRFFAAALALLLLPCAAVSSETDEGVVFFGAGASLGPQRRVTAPVTFDRRKAAGGGFIYAAPFMTEADAEAIRLSEGVLTTSGGALSWAARSAREHGVAAVILGQAVWRQTPRALTLAWPIFGPGRSSSGLDYRLVEKTVARLVEEGDVVTLEPERGALRLYAPGERPGRLAVAQAARAYDGLKDAQALVQWLEDRKGDGSAELLSPWLIEALAERLSDGTAPPEDFAKVQAAAARAAAPGPLKEFQKRLWARELRRGIVFLKQTQDAARAAATAAAAERLGREAQSRWGALGVLARAFGGGADLSPVGTIYRSAAAETSRKVKALSGKSTGLAEVAASAGAALPPRVLVGAERYRRFVSENKLLRSLEDVSSDASIDLRRKSARIRALFEKAGLGPELAQEIDGGVPAAWRELAVLSLGQRRKISRGELPAALASAWADLWGPGPLGERKRAGRPLSDEEATLAVEPLSPADVSGSMLTRAPNNSRSRLTISAGLGDLDAVAAPRASLDEYAVDALKGAELLPAVVAGPKRVLSAEQLVGLARLARALENHFGYGVEARFFFRGEALFLSQVAPLKRTF